MPGLFKSDMEKFQKQTIYLIIFSFDVILGKKEINMRFFEDLCFVRFRDEINFYKLKKSPKKHP
jgi:hypothetical protein